MSWGKRGSRSSLFTDKNASMRDEILYIIFQIMMVVFVGIMVFGFINDKTTDMGFHKMYIARDLGMITSALYGSPGNVMYTYRPPIEIENATLDISMEQTLVYVRQDGRDERNIPYHYYAADRSVPLFSLPMISYGSQITFYRFGYDIDRDIEQTNYNKITCPPIAREEDEDTPTPSWTQEKGVYFDVTAENANDLNSQRESQIGERLKTVLVNKNRFQVVETAAEAEVEIGFRIQRDTDVGSIRVYVLESSQRLKESRTLACSLINELLTPQTFVKYVQVFPVLNRTEEPWLQMLKETPERNNIRVIVEFGIQTEEQIDFENSANAVFNALSRFYGTSIRLTTSGATISASLLSSSMQAMSQSATAQQTAAASATTLPASQAACQGQSEQVIDFPFHDDTWLLEGQTDGGRLWIPAQANCPGAYPLMIYLHGIKRDPPRYIHASMNKGGTGEGGDDLTQEAKAVIDSGKARPFLMAAPSQSNSAAASSQNLWRGFDTTDFIRAVTEVLPSGMTLGPVIVIGHSGAGCSLNGGIHSAIKSSYQHFLIVQSDACLNGAYGRDLMSNLGSNTKFVSWFIPSVGAWGASRESGSPSYAHGWDEQNAVMGITEDVDCPDFSEGGATIDNCKKSPDKDWYSIPVRGLSSGGGSPHNKMKKLSVRFAATEFLSGSGTTTTTSTVTNTNTTNSTASTSAGNSSTTSGAEEAAP